MTTQWRHIPADSRLPEQWQLCPLVLSMSGEYQPSRTVAAVMRRTPFLGGLRPSGGEWHVVMSGPDGTMGTLMMTGRTPEQARVEVEMSLRDMGWE